MYTVDAGLHGGAIGDCATDSFSVSGSHFGSPAICGTNAGQHSKLHFFSKLTSQKDLQHLFRKIILPLLIFEVFSCTVKTYQNISTLQDTLTTRTIASRNVLTHFISLKLTISPAQEI